MGLARLLGQLFGRPSGPPRVPEALWARTLAGLPFLAVLDGAERARLRTLVERFLAEKEFSAVGGLTLTDAICVSIAAQGCLPILNRSLADYRGWVGIVVYPDEFVIPRAVEDEFGVVHEYEEVAAGEAWADGPLLISWRDAQMAGAGYNVVIHEFAHKLDMLNGPADGIPPLPPGIDRAHWENTLLAAYDEFRAEVEAAEAEDDLDDLVIDPYAAEHPGEFFAVLSEVFFEDPALVHSLWPALYTLFAAFYRQDPLTRYPASK